MSNKVFFPAEWHRQDFVQIAWPDEHTDWAYILPEAQACFARIIDEILKRQRVLVVCRSKTEMLKNLNVDNISNLSIVERPINDTWSRDFGGITVFVNGKPVVYDFTFNGWGMKFAANHDNQVTRHLFEENFFGNGTQRMNKKSLVLEGGSIETDGNGTLLTTEPCLLSDNRNDSLSKIQIEQQLRALFGCETIHWIKNGYLAGDDTDSHIDTLVRFAPDDTLVYVGCNDKTDEHFLALSLMEKELMALRTAKKRHYRLLKLPMPPAMYEDDGHRLPATYANYLIINGAVLVPVYNASTDRTALAVIASAYPGREIVPIDCTVLVRQHGSLHCVTMQYPEGVFN